MDSRTALLVGCLLALTVGGVSSATAGSSPASQADGNALRTAADQTPTKVNRSDGGATPTAKPTDTRTATPSLCGFAHGAAALCTATPTPTPTPTKTPVRSGEGPPTEPITTTDQRTAPPESNAADENWLAGFATLFAWIGVVAIVAPVVLAVLVGLDSVRGGSE